MVHICERVMLTALGGGVMYGWKETFSRSATTASSFLSRTSLGMVRKWSISSSTVLRTHQTDLLACSLTIIQGLLGIQTDSKCCLRSYIPPCFPAVIHRQ